MLDSLGQHLAADKLAWTFRYASDGQEEAALERAFQELHLITAKKVLYVCNVDERYLWIKGLNHPLFYFTIFNIKKPR